MKEETAADILEEMKQMYISKSAEYGANFTKPRDIIRILFPDGVPSELVDLTQWHIFEMIITKIVRFADNNLNHIDSIHDIGVYSAITEEIIKNPKKHR